MSARLVQAAKSRLALALAAALALPAGGAKAHAVVTESSLARQPVHPGHPATVALQFNSDVELKLSRVFLVSKGDVLHAVEFQRGKRPGELRILLPALAAGDYAIKYKVFAADGHLTESVIRFQVAVEANHSNPHP
jgi:methionine-rich copper-binding protein CopC